MSLRSFIKDIWQLIKDYKWMILGITIITTLLSLALVVFVNRQESSSEQSTDPETRKYQKVGMIDIYTDKDGENFQIEPHLPQTVIDDIHEWDTFRAFFSLNSSDPELTESEPLNNYFEDSSNPIEDFLGIDPTQHDNIKIHPDTGNAYMTLEINPDNGDMKLVNVQEGFNDFRIQLDVDAEEGTFAEDISEDTDDLMNFKIGMTPGSEQLGYIESAYNWTSGLNFPRMFAQRKNFYFSDPVAFTPTPTIKQDNGLSVKGLIVPASISIVIGLILGIAFSFMWAIFNKNIQYGFAYGWSVDDLYLKYDNGDNVKQITYDMLQSEFHHLAIITENELPGDLAQVIQNTEGKEADIYKEISDIGLDERIEEFVLVIQRNLTSKEWYQRQRKHLKTYRQKSVKIVEI